MKGRQFCLLLSPWAHDPVFQCKWFSWVDTYEAEIVADLLIWELFAKKSAECLNLRNSFFTISNQIQDKEQHERGYF